jgi:hypothetical protein
MSDSETRHTATIDVPTSLPSDAQLIANSLREIRDAAGKLVVENDEEYEAWARTLTRTEGYDRVLAQTRLALTRHLDRAKRGIMDLFRPQHELAKQIRELVGSAMLDYRRRKRPELQAQAARAQAALTQARDSAALAVAEKLVATGQPEQAQQLLARAASAPAPPAIAGAPAPKVDGISFRQEWDYAIEDAERVVREAPEYALPNEAKIRARVKTFGDQHGIPGVIAFLIEKLGYVRGEQGAERFGARSE